MKEECLICKAPLEYLETDTMMECANLWLRKLNARHPELPKINPHAFRHSMATALLADGMDIVGVSRRLGHAKPSTTVNIYAHLVDESDKTNSDALERLYAEDR